MYLPPHLRVLLRQRTESLVSGSPLMKHVLVGDEFLFPWQNGFESPYSGWGAAESTFEVGCGSNLKKTIVP